jgi:hypothetical protein
MYSRIGMNLGSNSDLITSDIFIVFRIYDIGICASKSITFYGFSTLVMADFLVVYHL